MNDIKMLKKMSHLLWLIFAVIMTIASGIFAYQSVVDGNALYSMLWGVCGTIWFYAVIFRAVLLSRVR